MTKTKVDPETLTLRTQAGRVLFKERIHAALAALPFAIHESVTTGDWIVATIGGSLRVHVMHQESLVASVWVHCRFADPALASKVVHYGDVNKHSGKWNHHYAYESNAAGAASNFLATLACILATEAHPKVTASKGPEVGDDVILGNGTPMGAITECLGQTQPGDPEAAHVSGMWAVMVGDPMGPRCHFVEPTSTPGQWVTGGGYKPGEKPPERLRRRPGLQGLAD